MTPDISAATPKTRTIASKFWGKYNFQYRI